MYASYDETVIFLLSSAFMLSFLSINFQFYIYMHIASLNILFAHNFDVAYARSQPIVIIFGKRTDKQA